MQIIKPQQMVVHAGSRITAILPGSNKFKTMILAEDVVVSLPLLDDIMVKHVEYDPDYGDRKICTCGHEYRNHFDTFSFRSSGCVFNDCACEDFEYDAKATAKRAKKIKETPKYCPSPGKEDIRDRLIRATLERKRKR